MTKEKIKYLLESYKYENQFLREKKSELNKLNEQYLRSLEKLKPIIIDENNQIFNDAMERYKSEYSVIEDEISKVITKKKEIEMLIEDISQPCRNVLYFKYVKCFSVEEIADKMNYSTQRIYQFHDKGMKELTEKEDD